MNHAIEAPAPTSSLAMIRTLGLVAALCGVIIVSVFRLTFDAVQENKRIAVERAVFRIIPAARSVETWVAAADGTLSRVADDAAAPPGGVRFFAGRDEAGRLAGVAAEAAAKGYADYVRILFACDPLQQHVTGFGVVFSRETPGIGDKVATDKGFLGNFPLDASVAGDGLAHAIATVKHGTKTQPWQIDAIAGATITSRAVGAAINDTAQQLLPRLVAGLDQLQSAAPGKTP